MKNIQICNIRFGKCNNCLSAEIEMVISLAKMNVICPKFGKRHGQVTLLFLMVLVTYTMRVMMSIAVVAMTDPDSSSNPDIPTFTWTNKSIILSAFFWGYIIPQIFAGWVSNRFGPKWFIAGSVFLGSITTLLIPTVAIYLGSVGVIVCRVFQGICQAFLHPSTHNLLAQWAPLEERSQFSALAYGGSMAGTVLSMFISGLLASSSYGWPSIFYTFSGTGIVMCIVFLIFGYSSPNEHPSITEEERNYICSRSGIVKKKKITPWFQIFTSVPVWAVILSHSGFVWTYDLMLTQVPNYMNNVLKFDMKQNAVLSPFPYLMYWIVSILLGFLADFLIKRKITTVGVARKIVSGIALITTAIAFIFLGNCDSSKPILAFVLLVVAVGACGGVMPGFVVNELDLAPNYAGTITGIIHTASSSVGTLSTISCQYIVQDETNPTRWRTMFYLSAGIGIVSCGIFSFFGSGEKQPWNDIEDVKREKEIEESKNNSAAW